MITGVATFWSRSLTWRLLSPVGLMLLLVCLLTLVSVATRTRLHRAHSELAASQDVRTDLTEVRSLSRSLQRDALNLLTETDRAELRVLHAKYRSRTEEMREGLDKLSDNVEFVDGPQRRFYLSSQQVVLGRLIDVAALAGRGDRTEAWRMFRGKVRPNERSASRIADELIVQQDRKVRVLFARTGELESQEVILSTLASLALFTLAATGTLLIVRRSVLRPLSDIERAMTMVAGGDTHGETPQVDRQDEIGRMARAIEVFRISVRERERFRVEQEKQQRDKVQQELAREQAKRKANEAAAGRSASIARSAQLLEAEIGEVLHSLRSSSSQLSTTSRNMTDHSAGALRRLNDIGGAVERAVSGATDIAAATDQFSTAIGDASQRTRRSADLTASAATQSGVLASRMARVQDTAGEIEEVVNLIAGIAKQTNLLALNASIEAARAGEAGAGFAVVAGEVKQLAGQTAQATDEIAGQIADMQLAAREAGDSLHLIQGMIADIAQEAERLAHSIGEQADSGKTINRNLTGAVADLDLIDGRVRDVATTASGIDGLASRINVYAEQSATMAATIDRALSIFFTDLEAVRAAIRPTYGAVLSRDASCREHRQRHQLARRCGHRRDLHRLLHADQHRPDHVVTAQLAEQLGGDVNAERLYVLAPPARTARAQCAQLDRMLFAPEPNNRGSLYQPGLAGVASAA